MYFLSDHSKDNSGLIAFNELTPGISSVDLSSGFSSGFSSGIVDISGFTGSVYCARITGHTYSATITDSAYNGVLLAARAIGAHVSWVELYEYEVRNNSYGIFCPRHLI